MYDYESGSELVLIRRARKGDARAFSELYAKVYVELYKFALYTLKHPQDAEDAVSEAVVSAYKNIGGLKKEESFRSWIFQILSNQCKQKFREMPPTEELNSEMPAPETDYEKAQDVRSAFQLLSEEERIIVALSVFGGYTSDEIGGMLNQIAATVRSKKSRALDKMRRTLGSDELTNAP